MSGLTPPSPLAGAAAPGKTRVSPPTAAETRVYDAMAELEAEHDGWPVTLEAVARRLGLAAKSTVHAHAEQLVRVGLVERSPFPKGGYRVNPHRRET